MRSMSEQENSGNDQATPKYSREDLLEPPFSSNLQIIGFIAVMAFALLLPVLITASAAISRRDSYRLMPEHFGAYSFAEKEIFEEKGDIDILFVGSSVTWQDIDAPQIQKALSEELGRPATVLLFGHNFNDMDITYAKVRDLLQKRRVRLVVTSVLREPFTEGPSQTAFKFLRYGEYTEPLEGLPAESRISLYSCSVLRGPRDLLTIARQDKTEPSPYADDFGAFKAELGMGRDKKAFKEYSPVSPVVAANDLIYSPARPGWFEFTNTPIPLYQDRYLEELVKMLHRENVPLAMINLPDYKQRHESKVTEWQEWSKRFGREIPILGIPPSVLFAGLNEDEIERLYCDTEHLNINGNEFFTRAVLPAILKVYDDHATKNN